ncbi:phenylalanine--tRNA ligase subunit alpha, partial [Brevibacillus laterosporus]|nr:phenylalanine--tRNA ligase subunit alpha [Brevibacillus laterosporus]
MTQNDLMSELKQQALVDINEAKDAQALQEVKVKYLGKKGSVSALMKNMKDLPNEDKP